MTAVVIKDGGALQQLAAFAARPENHYRLAAGVACPADDPAFVRLAECVLVNPNLGQFEQTLRVVFSITEMGDGKRYRHASFTLVGGSSGLDLQVPVQAPGFHGELRSKGMPAPSAVQAVCMVLGYQGGMNDWIVDFEGHRDDPHPVIVVAQELDAIVTKGDA